MAGPSSTGNYAQAGRAASSAATDFFKINRENAPDMAGLVQKAAEVKAKETQAAYAVQSEILQRGVGEVAKTVNYKEGMEAEVNAKSAKRKAGLLAAAGGYVGTGIGGLGESDYKKRVVGESDSYYDTRIKSAQEQIADLEKQAEDFKTNGLPDLNGESST